MKSISNSKIKENKNTGDFSSIKENKNTGDFSSIKENKNFGDFLIMKKAKEKISLVWRNIQSVSQSVICREKRIFSC